MPKLLIVGGGKMGFAIAQGITSKNIYKKQDIVILEKNSDRRSFIKKSGYMVLSKFPDSLKNRFQITILAVKPNDIKEVLQDLKGLISKKTLIISIAAGIKISLISLCTSKEQPISRIMPNLPVEISKGVIAVTFNNKVTKLYKSKVNQMFSTLGKTFELPEDDFDLTGRRTVAKKRRVIMGISVCIRTCTLKHQ